MAIGLFILLIILLSTNNNNSIQDMNMSMSLEEPKPIIKTENKVETKKTNADQLINTTASSSTPPALPLVSGAENSLTTPKYLVLRSTDQVTFSSELSASVADIFVKEGSRFHKGEVLLKLDCDVQQAELNKSLAQLEEANMAKQSAAKLETYEAISTFELLKAKTDAQEAQADVNKLKAIVEKCTITAPFNGAVAAIMTHRFETVKPGDPLLKIVNTDNLEVSIQVPSPWLAWLHVDSQIKIHINELNRDVNANVVRINPQIEAISQTVKIIAVINQPDSDLLPGMSGVAIFPDNPNQPPHHDQ